MDEKGLGQRLQAMRVRAGLTQQALCQQAGLSYSTLTKIERGAIKSPSIFTIQSIAQALHLGLDELMQNGLASATKNRKSRSGVSFVYFDINGCLVRFYHRAFTRLAEVSGAPADVIETAFWHYNDEVCRGDMTMDAFNKAFAKALGLEKLDWLEYYLETVDPIDEMHEIVKWATKKAGCPPNEILLIDDARTNLMAAEKHGWHVLWFDDYSPEESIPRIKGALEPAN